jgi:hypothetical protein
MNAPEMKERIAEESPRLDARFAAVFYLLTLLSGGFVFFIHEKLGFAVVTACYLAATALVYALFKYDLFKYDLFKPASRTRLLCAASHKLLRGIAEPSSRVHKEARRTI